MPSTSSGEKSIHFITAIRADKLTEHVESGTGKVHSLNWTKIMTIMLTFLYTYIYIYIYMVGQ